MHVLLLWAPSELMLCVTRLLMGKYGIPAMPPPTYNGTRKRLYKLVHRLLRRTILGALKCECKSSEDRKRTVSEAAATHCPRACPLNGESFTSGVITRTGELGMLSLRGIFGDRVGCDGREGESFLIPFNNIDYFVVVT
jgi:hypothetical protein